MRPGWTEPELPLPQVELVHLPLDEAGLIEHQELLGDARPPQAESLRKPTLRDPLTLRDLREQHEVPQRDTRLAEATRVPQLDLVRRDNHGEPGPPRERRRNAWILSPHTHRERSPERADSVQNASRISRGRPPPVVGPVGHVPSTNPST